MPRFRQHLIASAIVIAAVASVPRLAASADAGTDRASIDAAASRLEASLRQSVSDRFSGLWIESDGTVHVAVTAKNTSVAHALASFPYQDRLRLSTAQHPLTELETAQHRVDADLAVLTAGGALVTETYVDPKSNALVVGLAPESASSAAADVRQRYAGVPLEVATADYARPTACLSRSQCAPEVEGGVEIDHDNGDGTTTVCTSGVVAGQGTNTKVLLTAGHCFAQGAQVTDSNIPLGNVSQQLFGGSVDGEVIGITFEIPALYQWNPTRASTRAPRADRTPSRASRLRWEPTTASRATPAAIRAARSRPPVSPSTSATTVEPSTP